MTNERLGETEETEGCIDETNWWVMPEAASFISAVLGKAFRRINYHWDHTLLWSFMETDFIKPIHYWVELRNVGGGNVVITIGDEELPEWRAESHAAQMKFYAIYGWATMHKQGCQFSSEEIRSRKKSPAEIIPKLRERTAAYRAEAASTDEAEGSDVKIRRRVDTDHHALIGTD
jgi:hypothetical protein